jgi:large subunit ribosomal protein L23
MDTKYLEIIKAPLVTEKGRGEQEKGKYTFLVSSKASKTEIKEAVEKIFKVEVVDVQTLNMPVKKKRVGRYAGLSNRCKKAIVTLKAGQTIEMN